MRNTLLLLTGALCAAGAAQAQSSFTRMGQATATAMNSTGTAVVGFDNQETLAPFLRPALTTMNLPFREMGWAAVDLLLTGSATKDDGSRTIRLHCDLVDRDSVAPPKETR